MFVWLLQIAAILGAMAAKLLHQGRIWWCKCGKYDIWSGDIRSMHNSQHIVDPYSFTHILHGIIGYFILEYIFYFISFIYTVPVWYQFLACLVIEAVWEVIENGQKVIDRYRASTVSLGYNGDSIANSVSDTIACGLGFWFSYYTGSTWAIVFTVITELGLLLWIRDNLTLNILMLVYPIDAIKKWQQGK